MFRGLESRGLFNRRIWGCQGREGSNLALTMLTWFHGFSTIPRPGATDPPSQTPRLGSFLANEIFENFHCAASRFSSLCCWLSVLRQGPVDKNDGEPCENLRTYKGICDTNIKPCPPPKIWSQHHELKPRWISAKTRYCLWLCVGFCLWLYKSQNTLPCPTFIWLPSMSESLGKIPVAQHLSTCPKPRLSHKSRTPLVHHFIPYFSTIPKPGATNPRPKHQALAPSLPTALLYKSILVRALFTFNASARACGQKRWPTMSNLRHTQKSHVHHQKS